MTEAGVACGPRSERAQLAVAAAGLDALIVSARTNIQYLSGFTGSNGTLVVTPSQLLLVTDSRYTAWATSALEEHDVSIELRIAPGSGRAEILDYVGDADSIGIEADHVSWTDAKAWRDALGAHRTQASSGLIERLRLVKDTDEVEQLARAASVGDDALARLVPELRPGRTEVETARRLAQHMYEIAGVDPSFDIIVASGPNSARPHHAPSDRQLAVGDLVVIDSGATVGGYRSDMTRTFILGPPSPQQREMLDVVLEAQRLGVEAVASGRAASFIDEACRSYIARSGLGEYFTHGTGHGVGLDIHEAPSVSSASTATLAPGHIITVEPGVYIPDVGGVRWEDTVVVTSNGCTTLTQSPKQPLIEL